MAPVHPRLRGELGLRKARLLTLHGSSPLTRGTHWRHYEFRFRCSVHPRLRGELLAAITGVSAAIGSSPLTRGTQAQPHIRADLTRFIPAYAGNSAEVAPPTAPRDGSSPLTRGTQIEGRNGVCWFRFIPAYAGNSSAGHAVRPKSSVHPRLRGELPDTDTVDWVSGGSSPLTRGTQLCQRRQFKKARFIPAYAGNSGMPQRPESSKAVHPRLRGELDETTPHLHMLVGSSPLTRGTRLIFR